MWQQKPQPEDNRAKLPLSLLAQRQLREPDLQTPETQSLHHSYLNRNRQTKECFQKFPEGFGQQVTSANPA